jgi:hypothetical protein
MPLQLRALRLAADLRQSEAPDALLGQSDHLGHGVVDPAQPQPLVVDRDGTGRLDERRRGERAVRGGGDLQRGDHEPVTRAAVPRAAVVGEQPHGHGAAVAVAERDGAVPAGALGGEHRVGIVADQQIRGGVTHDLRSGAAQQALGAAVPLPDRAEVVDDSPCRRGIVERVVRAHRRHSIADTHSEQVRHLSSRLVRHARARTGTPCVPGGAGKGDIRPL